MACDIKERGLWLQWVWLVLQVGVATTMGAPKINYSLD